MSENNVTPIRPPITPEQRLADQIQHLAEFAAMAKGTKEVKRLASCVVVEMDDGSLVVSATGFADDQRAQQYFLTFMRNHGWPA